MGKIYATAWSHHRRDAEEMQKRRGCDLKPENVFIAPEMRIRFTDLGLSERFVLDNMDGYKVGTEGFCSVRVMERRPNKYCMGVFSYGYIYIIHLML